MRATSFSLPDLIEKYFIQFNIIIFYVFSNRVAFHVWFDILL
jgi:hypothetical protein